MYPKFLTVQTESFFVKGRIVSSIFIFPSVNSLAASFGKKSLDEIISIILPQTITSIMFPSPVGNLASAATISPFLALNFFR